MRWFMTFLFAVSAHAGTGQVNLDDIKIDGELQKEGFSLHARDRFEIEKNIEVRNSFRDLILEYLPPGYQHKVSADDDSH
jgi:hypothetical protein